MDRPKIEVADVFRRYGAAYRLQHGASLSVAQRRVMTAIESCRTAVLGGHLERCDQCGHETQRIQLVRYGEYFLMGSSASASALGWPFRMD